MATNLDDGERIARAISLAVRDAVIRHKKLGQSIVVWQDGKVVTIPARRIRVASSSSRSPGRPATRRKK